MVSPLCCTILQFVTLSNSNSALVRFPCVGSIHQLTCWIGYRSDSPIPSFKIGTMPYLRSLTMSDTPCSLNGANLPSLLYLEASCHEDRYGRPHTFDWIDINDIPSQIRVLKLRGYTLHQRRTSPRHFPDLYELNLGVKSNLIPESIMAPKLKTFSLFHKAPNDDYDVTPELITFWLNGLPLRSALSFCCVSLRCCVVGSPATHRACSRLFIALIKRLIDGSVVPKVSALGDQRVLSYWLNTG